MLPMQVGIVLYAGQMSGDGFAAGLGARAGFDLTLRRGFELHLGAE
jgi:hypothetical protein